MSEYETAADELRRLRADVERLTRELAAERGRVERLRAHAREEGPRWTDWEIIANSALQPGDLDVP